MAIALSLSSAPPFVEQQLHDAARATMSASGFALKDTNSVTALRQSQTKHPTRSDLWCSSSLYQAPASVQETEVEPNGATASVILIGDRRFRKSGSSWIELPPSAGLGARAVATITAPLQGAIDATQVTRQGDRYSFVPRDLDKVLTAVLDVDPSRLSSPRLTAVVRGGTLDPGDDHRHGHQPTPRGGPGLLRHRLGTPGDRPPVSLAWRRPRRAAPTPH